MDAVEEIKSRISIEDVVSPHVDLRRSGVNLKGLCPFHSEKTPSFYVFPARGSYHCFGCGQGGDVLSFVEAYDKVDFREALRRLASQAGLELPDERKRQEQVEANARLYAANDAAAEYFRDQLKARGGKPAVAYCERRGISHEVAHRFGLGYAADAKGGLAEALAARGFTEEELLAAGLVVRREDGTLRDRFHARLMFPIRDGRSRITGFGGRILGQGEPKYLNSPQTEIFDKSRTLYALDLAQEPIRTGKQAVVVEGYLDAIRAHAHGFQDVVASLGTAVTPAQLQTLSRLAPTVILALDPDAAGQAASARTLMSVLAGLPRRQRQLPDSRGRQMVEVGLAVDLRVASMTEAQGDPDELIARSPDAWPALVAASVPAFEYYFQSSVNSVDRSSESWRQDLIDRIIPIIAEFPFALGVQAAWIERLADVTKIESRLLQSRLPSSVASSRPPGKRGRISQRVGASTPPSAPLERDGVMEAEDALLAILLFRACPAVLTPALSELAIARPAAAEILSLAISGAGTSRRPSIDKLTPGARQMAEKLLAGTPDTLSEDRMESAVRLHIAAIRRHVIRRRVRDWQVLAAEIPAEDLGLVAKQRALLDAELLELDRQIDELREIVAGGRGRQAGPGLPARR